MFESSTASRTEETGLERQAFVGSFDVVFEQLSSAVTSMVLCGVPADAR
jgi:hypothetical protein